MPAEGLVTHPRLVRPTDLQANTDRLRVIHVVRQFTPSVGGLEDAVSNLVRHQRSDQGMDARVVTLDRLFTAPDDRLPSHAMVDGIPVERIAWRGSSRYPLAPAILGRIAEADLVHVHAIDFFFDFLAWTKPFHGKPLVASTHGGFFHTDHFKRLKQVYFGTVTRASLMAYAKIVACSVNDLRLFRPVGGERLTLIENGVNIAKFADCSSRTPTRHLLYFGRWTAHKRIEHLFPILRALHAIDPEWRLTVAGSPADRQLTDLVQAAEQAGVAAAVTFAPSPSDAEIKALMGQATYFACTSAYEGFGIAAVEALSAGLIPCLSLIPCFERLVRRTQMGALIDPLDAAGAAGVIQALALEIEADHPRQRAQAAAAASVYDWALVAGSYAGLYAKVLAGRVDLTPAGLELRR